MVEWFKAAVLKTAVGQLTEGSNPSSSAIFLQKNGGTKTQVFSSLCRQAQLHSKNEVFSSHLHQTPEALLVKSFHSADASFHL